jgi:lysophospholipase L1-like esterase
MDQYPNKIFIVLTPPPEILADSDAQAAARARAFADWLASDEYLSGHSNVFTFNFFDLLADSSTHMLRDDYQMNESDAHPNELANQTIGPLFADFIDQSITTYTGG